MVTSFEAAEKDVTGYQTRDWSSESIDGLVQQHFSSVQSTSTLSIEPIRNIVIVGAVVAENGCLTKRDRDFIGAFFAELIRAGIPVDPKVEVINYNLADGTDVFGRSEPADALLACHVNKIPSKHDLDQAPIFDGSTDDNHYYFHISSKSVSDKAWANLGRRLQTRIFAAFAYGRAVGVHDFIPQTGRVCWGENLASPNEKTPYDHWKDATGGDFQTWKRLPISERKRWQDPPAPPLPCHPSDVLICPDPVVLKHRECFSHGGDMGHLRFALSRGFLDEATNPQLHTYESINQRVESSALGPTIEKYAWQRKQSERGSGANHLITGASVSVEPVRRAPALPEIPINFGWINGIS